jgi:hypothetical protein
MYDTTVIVRVHVIDDGARERADARLAIRLPERLGDHVHGLRLHDAVLQRHPLRRVYERAQKLQERDCGR